VSDGAAAWHATAALRADPAPAPPQGWEGPPDPGRRPRAARAGGADPGHAMSAWRGVCRLGASLAVRIL
jgi:hypothetical protein